MKKKLTFFAFLAALLFPLGAIAQEELTVCDGTQTSTSVPFCGYYHDYGFRTEMLYTADMLEEMVGGTITSLTFYADVDDRNWTATTTVKMEEISASELSTAAWNATAAATEIYSGPFSLVNHELEIELDEGFQYQGGNLLITFYAPHGGTLGPSGTNFICAAATNKAVYKTGSSSSFNEAPPLTSLSVLPKCTFTYTAGSGTICLKPNNLQVSNTTTEGADFTWNTRNGESSWNVYVDGEFVTTVSDSSYTATGLSASSQHTFGVAAVCADDSTSGVATVSFRTACGSVALPWGENFDSYASSTRPDCWSILQSYSTYPYVSSSYSVSGSRSFYFYAYGNSPNMATTPLIDTEVNQLHVTFSARISNNGILYAGIMTDTSDVSTFIPLLTINGNSTTWTEYEFFTDTVSASGNGYVVFRWTAESGYACYIDDVIVEVSSDCRRPVSAMVSQPTYEGATISWVDNGTAATGYTVRVSTTNNVDAANAIDMPFASSPAVVTDLNSSTTYYAWVATNCGSEQTMWRYAGSFTTQNDCYSVTGLTVADKSMSSAAITWAYQEGYGREATGVNIRLIDQSATPADTTTLTATGTSTFLTGLASGHTYKVEVSTVCDTFSASSQSVTFETPSCGQIQGTSTTSYSPFHPNYNYGYSQTIYPASDLQGLSEINAIKFRQSSTPQGVYNRPIKVWIGNTTQSTLDTNDYIDVNDMTLVYNGNINVATAGWKTITFNEAFTHDGVNNIVVAVQNLTGEYKSFSWGAHTATAGNTVYWYRDADTIRVNDPNAPHVNGTTSTLPSRGKSTTVPDITFVGDCETPACLAPLAVFNGCTSNSATLTWIAGSEETSWTVEYRPYGDTAWATATASTNQTTYTVTGLDAATLYEFRVGSLCSGATLYSPAFTGRTACGAITLPYTENFEGWTGSYPFHACWYRVLNNGDHPYINNSTYYHHSGSACMYSYNSGVMFASPEVPAAANNIKVTFWGYNWNSTSNRAGIVTDPTDPSSFVACSVAATGAYENSMYEYEFYTDDVTATGNVYVAFSIGSSSQVYIDDITISEAGDCRKPNTPSRNNIGYYTATLHWNDVNNGTVTYEVRYSRVNNVEAEGYMSVTATGDSIELTGLSNGVTYYAWVRPQCSTDSADWLAIPVFSTLVSCYNITGIALDGKTFTTASLNWNYSTNGITADGVVINLMDNADSSMVVEDLYVTGTNHIFTGLTAGHSYKAYFNSICNPDTSAGTTFSFTLDAPACAETATDTTSTMIPLYGYYKYGYTQTIYPASIFSGIDTISGVAFNINSSSSQSRTIDLFIGLTDRDTLSLESYLDTSEMTRVILNRTWSLNQAGWRELMFDTPFAYDGTSNVVIAIYNHTGEWAATTWKATKDTLARSIYWGNDNSTAVNLGNPSASTTTIKGVRNLIPQIRVMGACGNELPCAAPILTITGATTNSVSLEWAADNGSEYTVEYRESVTSEWTVADDQVNATTYTVTGLQASTSYDFRVGNNCSEDNVLYSTVKSSYTDCDAMAVPVTFTFTSELSPCWVLSNSNVSRNATSNALYWSSSNYDFGRAFMPELDQPINTLMAVITARYGYSSGSNHNLLVGVGNSDGTNVTWVDTLDLTGSYAEYLVYFNDYEGTGNRIVLSKNGGNYIYVQSIAVSLDNGCHPMNSVSVTAVTTTSATLAWSHQSASDFEVQYQLHGDATWQSQTFSGNSGTLTGLQPSSSYDARVRAICSETDSSLWSATISFNTACDAISALPWSEDFNDATAGQMPNCWDKLFNGTDASSYAPQVYSNDTYLSGNGNNSKALRMRSSTGSSTGNNNMVILPTFNADIASLVISFSYRYESTSYGTLSVGYVTGSDYASDFVEIESLPATTTWTFDTVSLEEASINATNIAFRWTSNGTSWYSVGIDDITVDMNGDIPVIPCAAPTNVTASNITATSATISWTDDDATMWNVELYKGDDLELTGGMSTNPYTFNNLTEGTTYRVRVQAICNLVSYSEWSDFATFTTSNQGIAHADDAAISLWPNPASNRVTIEGIEAGSHLTLIDMNGRVNGKWSVESGEITIDLTGYAKGAYFVRVTNDNGTAVRKLVVK